ncbi:hypothetical protein JTB14_019671 [Gonioctena quinquepunctata]|nr:hypothetical protein JTB14_019671 [Gonioctena quinquepunctata]
MFRKVTTYCFSVNNSKYVFRTLRNAVNKDIVPSNTNASLIEQNVSEDIALSDVAPQPQKPHRTQFSELSEYLRPGAVSSLYVNKSDSLQQLLKLGLKFEDYRDHVLFLKDLNVPTEKIGKIITNNPFFLKEHLNDLQVRLNYLQYKRFTDEMIQRIVETNPFWLTHSTKNIDDCLGFFQHTFSLRGKEVRQLAVKNPKLITYPLEKVKLNIFVLKEEMGFTQEELKKVVLDKPKLFMMDQNKILRTFEYLHKTMNVPLERIVEEPGILTCRPKRLIQRHRFLAELNRAQYDPKKPNFVGLASFVFGDDCHFCTEVAKSSVQVFNTFLKSM